VRRFAQRLESRFALPVDLVDEHLTSWEASRKLTHAGVGAHSQEPHIDQLAACIILTRWFDARRTV
jgi:putative Holliday junction resolvase